MSQCYRARDVDLDALFVERAAKDKRLLLPGGGHAILLERPHVIWQNEVRRCFEQDWD